MNKYIITIQQRPLRGHNVSIDMGDGANEYVMLADDIETVMEGVSESIVEKHNNSWTYDRNGGDVKTSDWGYIFYNGVVTNLRIYENGTYILKGNFKKKYDAVFPDKIKCLEVFKKNIKYKVKI